MKNLLTGGPIHDLEEGWAVMPFGRETAHYWQKGADLGEGATGYMSLCGVKGVTLPKAPALEPGNFPRCKRCQRKAR